MYAAHNTGFIAKPRSLGKGYGISSLVVATERLPGLLQNITIRQIDETPIKRIFCFPTHQNGMIVNTVLAVTGIGVYHINLFGNVTMNLIPNTDITNFDCFAYSYSRDRDFVFAANSDGVFVADRSLVFKKLWDNIRAKQMMVLDNRLFILDNDGQRIHFTKPLDLLEIEGTIRIDTDLGNILSLDVYEGKLLVVCENGFKVMTSSFDSTRFNITTLCRSYERVIDGSAKALGDTIYFLTAGGMCSAQRGNVTLLDIEINPEEANVVASTVYDNKYFLSTGTSMIVIEKFLDSVTVYKGMNVRAFERIHNRFTDRLAVLTDADGSIFQIEQDAHTRERVWESEDFNLNYASGNQYVRQVFVKTAYDIDVIVQSNRSEQRFPLKGSEGVQQINLNLKGEVFRIRLVARGTSDVCVTALRVVVGF